MTAFFTGEQIRKRIWFSFSESRWRKAEMSNETLRGGEDEKMRDERKRFFVRATSLRLPQNDSILNREQKWKASARRDIVARCGSAWKRNAR